MKQTITADNRLCNLTPRSSIYAFDIMMMIAYVSIVVWIMIALLHANTLPSTSDAIAEIIVFLIPALFILLHYYATKTFVRKANKLLDRAKAVLHESEQINCIIKIENVKRGNCIIERVKINDNKDSVWYIGLWPRNIQKDFRKNRYRLSGEAELWVSDVIDATLAVIRFQDDWLVLVRDAYESPKRLFKPESYRGYGKY